MRRGGVTGNTTYLGGERDMPLISDTTTVGSNNNYTAVVQKEFDTAYK